MDKQVKIPTNGSIPLPKHVAMAYQHILKLDRSGQEKQFVTNNVYGGLEAAFGKSAFAVYVALKRRGLIVPSKMGLGKKDFVVFRRSITVTEDDYVPRSKKLTTIKSKQLFLSGMISIGYEYLLSLDPKQTSEQFEIEGITTILKKRFGINRATHMYTDLKRRGLIVPGQTTTKLQKMSTVFRMPYQTLGGKPGFDPAPPAPKSKQPQDQDLVTLHQYFISNHRFIAELERKKEGLKRLGYDIVLKDGELLLKRL